MNIEKYFTVTPFSNNMPFIKLFMKLINNKRAENESDICDYYDHVITQNTWHTGLIDEIILSSPASLRILLGFLTLKCFVYFEDALFMMHL